MAYSTDIQLGSSGQIFASENGNLYLAFNDNVFTNNTGNYIFNLYLSGQLVGSKTVIGNYNNWQPAFGLVGGQTYTYNSSGLVSNGDTNWNADGWVGHIAESVTSGGISSAYVRQSYSLATPSTIRWPGGNLVPGSTTYSAPRTIYYTTIQPNITNRDTTVIVNSRLKDRLAINQNVINSNAQNVGGYQVISGYQFDLAANRSFTYGVVMDAFTTVFPNAFPKIGGTVEFIFVTYEDFLAPSLTAYSLVGQFIGLSSPNICLNIGGYSIPSTGNPSTTGSGFNPPNTEIPDTSNNINSGFLFLSIENNGPVCSGDILQNKIVQFSVDSYFPTNYELQIDCDFLEPNTSYAKYLSFTQDDQYTLQYTGYTTISGLIPITYLTGSFPVYGNLTGLIPSFTTGIDSGVQTCYYSGTTGSGIVATGTGILQEFFNQAIPSITGSGSGYITYFPYYQQSGTGVITEIISGFDPQMTVYQDGGITAYNDDWLNSFYVTQIRNLTTGQNITLPYIEAANLFDIVGGSGFSVIVSKSPKYTEPNSYIRKNQTTIQLVSDSGYRYNTLTAPLAAWASYNVTSGMNSKNVIGYAIEIANDLILSGQEVVDTGILRSVPPSIFSTGVDIRTQYIGYCIASEGLDCEEKEIQDVSVCFTGDPNSTEYNTFVSGVLNRFRNAAVTPYDPPGLQTIQSGVIPAVFQFWSGELEFNTFISGDQVVFDLYPFDYTGLYQQYFYTNPLYLSTGFTLTYPTDFNTISGLVSGLNTRLSTFQYPVWYPYECVSGSGQQGIYGSGTGLLQANVRQLSTGDINYNNIIDFYSLRNNTGYYFNLNLISREITKSISNNKLKYLLPSYISLQGSNDNSTWTNLNIQSGVNWTGITPTQKIVTGIASGIPDNLNIVNVTLPFEEEVGVDETAFEGGYQDLYNFIQSGVTKLGPNCPPQYFTREVSIIKPTGFDPSTIFDPETCAPSGEDNGGDEDEDGPESTGMQNSGNPEYLVNYLRTGWVLDASGAGQPITGISYNYYRVYLSGFSGLNTNYETLTNTFIIDNINLYSSLVNQISIHTGEEVCAIGADYTCQVQGNVLVRITGVLTGEVRPTDSGIRCYDEAIITGLMSGYTQGSAILFNKESGYLTTNVATGFFTDCITGTGCQVTGIDGWFYDTGTHEVTTRIEASGCSVSGSGIYSGNWIQLNQDVVNRELALGGFLSPYQYLTITTGAFFTGFLPGYIFQSGLSGFFNLPIIITGNATSGFINYSACFTGITPTLNYSTPTGYINATGVIFYNNPQSFDYVSINTNQIFFNTDTTNYQPPNFYDSYATLLNIINSNPNIYQVTGSGNGTGIYLTSLYSGTSGNSIQLAASGSTGAPYVLPIWGALTGGADLYQHITGTGTYSGCINISVPMTGFYSSTSGTGIITGDIPTFLGVRQFTGLWNMVTGNQPFIQNFRNNGWFYNGNMYSGSVSGLTLGNVPSNFNIFIDYTNTFDSPNFDVVQLGVWDTHYGPTGSGVGFLLTGV